MSNTSGWRAETQIGGPSAVRGRGVEVVSGNFHSEPSCALPQPAEGGQQFAQLLAGDLRGHAAGHPRELVGVGAPADTELETAPADVVEERRLPGQADRMPVGGAQHGGAEANPFRDRGEVGEQGEGSRRDGHLVTVVLADEDAREAGGLGGPREFGDVREILLERDRGIASAQIEHECEFHGVSL